MINRIPAFSSSAVLPTSPSSSHIEVRHIEVRPADHSFEGIGANVKLLLKLIQDHNEACTKDNDDRKTQRVAGIISIIDEVKSRIQKSQTAGNKKELRRCNTDLKPNAAPPKDKRPHEPVTDEKEKLRRSLSASLAARKSLEIMCSSLGKEKEIIATELARKVQELNGVEEHINDLRTQNEKLLAKAQAYAAELKENRCGSGEDNTAHGNAALRERNKELSEQLLKSLDGCKSLKRKVRDAQKENDAMHLAMEEIGVDVQDGLDRIRCLKERIAAGNAEIEEELSALEHLCDSCNMKISKHKRKKVEKNTSCHEVDAT